MYPGSQYYDIVTSSKAEFKKKIDFDSIVLKR